MKKLGFGELELSILHIMREKQQATVRDVYAKLGSKGSYTTTMTVMSRMAEKGDLIREKVGKHYIYSIAPQNKSKSKSILQRLRDKLFGGKGAAMASYLLELEEDVSDTDLDLLEKLIQKKRKNRV